MTSPSFPNPPNAPSRKYEVTPLELFFDLVFVFAVSQLSHHLLANLSWRGATEALVMLRAVFAVWFTTSWSATIIPAEQSRTRRLVLAVMLLGLFMNASVTRAFTASAASGWAFVVPLLLIQLGRTVWTLVHAPDAVFRDHYFRTLLWLVAISPLWLVGAAVDPDSRLLWWALAAGLDLIGAWLAHPIPGRRLQSENRAFDADHMLERCSLFLLIALGETVFTTGTAIAAAPMTGMTLLTGTAALAGTVALWALGFGRSHHLILQHVEETKDPIRASRHAVNVLMVMVAGLIAVAAANQMVIAHPQGHASVALGLLLYGGPVLFLVAQGLYLWAVPRVSPRLHLAGSVALVLVGCAALIAPPYVALVLAGASLTILVMVDWQYSTERDAPARPTARPRSTQRS
jgi:low temperature requirement protein LtrA